MSKKFRNQFRNNIDSGDIDGTSDVAKSNISD
jgi:hypothetical protein